MEAPKPRRPRESRALSILPMATLKNFSHARLRGRTDVGSARLPYRGERRDGPSAG